VFASLGDLLTDVTVVPTGAASANDDTPAAIRIGGGGQAANWCAWVAHLGGAPRLITRVGDDDAGRRLVDELRRGGVEVCAVWAGEPTGAVVALIGPGGERSFFTQRGASVGLGPAELPRACLAGATLLHLPLYSLLEEPLATAARLAAGWAREVGAPLAIDLSSASGVRARGPALVRADLRDLRPTLLFATEDEAGALDARPDDLAALAVVKLGANGCRIGDRVYPAVAARAVDSTGAGDAFAAGFCVEWARSGDRERAVAAALAAGAAAVTRIGGRP
jgi:ribokinase